MPISNKQNHAVTVSPPDEYNRQLLNNVHPSEWVNPQPASCYDLVVIGAGTAGLVAAKGAAGLGIGLKVALIEKYLMGGDCLNVGCVPSKCMIRSSRVVAEIQEAEHFGVRSPDEINVDFAAVMARMRGVRTKISSVDSAAAASKDGVDVFFGEASFVSKSAIAVGGQTLNFKKAVIATGARAANPKIEGLAEAGYLTNETVFSLTELPPRLAVIGGGPIGCELAQTFNRLGSEVILFQKGDRILTKEDAEAATTMQQIFVREGINLVLNSQLERVQLTERGKLIHYSSDGKPKTVVVDDILVGAGRQPNVELNLEAAGVEYDFRRGVKVSDNLQTSNSKIYAAGDICMNWKFTHAADAAARIVIKNALFTPFGLGKSQLSNLVMPWVTYTDPEIAHVGMYEAEAREKGVSCNTIKIDFEDIDRALADGEAGFLKLLHQQDSDKILGATIVARHAGEMISEVTTAIVGGLGLNDLANVIHPYPTQAEAIRKAADAYRRTLLTPRTKTLLSFLTKLS